MESSQRGKSADNPRHILGLSGGKDSSALAILIKEKMPDVHEKIEYFFTDTGVELEEVYDYLHKLENYLGKPITILKATDNKGGYRQVDVNDGFNPFDYLLKDSGIYKGLLPSPMKRWCTRTMKILPMEKWIGDDHCVSYIGIRADEERGGYQQKKNVNIVPKYPFKSHGITLKGVYEILERTIGLPEYYKWRTRSGCYFCFYQRRVEYAILTD